MEQMKELDKKAYDWLVKKPPNQWSRSHFSTLPKCNVVLNNMCESFNSFISPIKDEPILNMLENIRNMIMTGMQVNMDSARGWDGLICLKIKKLLERNKKDASECIPIKLDNRHYQIISTYDQHTVDVHKRFCSCKRWDLTSIPCRHAISAILCRNKEPEAFVHDFYKVSTYFRAYEHVIFGMNGPELWPKSYLLAPLPPSYENRLGRPKKLRRRELDELSASFNLTKLKKVQKSLECSKYRALGHNERTCKKKDTSTSASYEAQLEVPLKMTFEDF